MAVLATQFLMLPNAHTKTEHLDSKASKPWAAIKTLVK